MNLLADENIDRQIVERLRQDGHDVLYIAEVEPSIPDKIVFDRANEKLALLVTADKDFGEIVFRDKRLSSGEVVLLRLAGLPAEKKAEIVSDLFRERGAEFANHFSIIAPGKVRIRPKEAT
jgi:predicted nuclease of predicted toxin-antitoxin system